MESFKWIIFLYIMGILCGGTGIYMLWRIEKKIKQ